MLHIQDLTINHKKDLKYLVKNLTVTIQKGDKVAIIGEEGTGKSSLMAYLSNPQNILDHCLVTGSVQNTFHKSLYLPQILPENLANLSIGDFLYQDIDYENFDFNLLYQVAGQVGFDSKRFDDQEQTLGQLSGGERLKIQILKLLAQKPDLLFLDEPSSDLDLATLEWLEKIIKNSPITIVFISHDEAFLSQTATKIIHLEKLKKGQDSRTILANLDYDTYQKERQEEFDKQTSLAKKEREEHRKRLDKLYQTKSAVHHALNTTKDSTSGRLLKKKMKNLQSREKRYQKEAEHFTPLPDNPDRINLQFKDDTAIKGHQALLIYDKEILTTGQTCKLTIHKQDKIAIIGQNGIGKSLLLKKLYHDLQLKLAKIGYMPQSYQDIFKTKQTVLDFLTTDCPKEQEARLLLASLNFNRQEIFHAVNQLSGGQVAKLFLAKMVLEEKTLLLLDEPTRYLAPTSQPEIRRLLRDYQGTLITVSHDRRFIADVCDKVYELDDKELKRVR